MNIQSGRLSCFRTGNSSPLGADKKSVPRAMGVCGALIWQLQSAAFTAACRTVEAMEPATVAPPPPFSTSTTKA